MRPVPGSGIVAAAEVALFARHFGRDETDQFPSLAAAVAEPCLQRERVIFWHLFPAAIRVFGLDVIDDDLVFLIKGEDPRQIFPLGHGSASALIIA